MFVRGASKKPKKFSGKWHPCGKQGHMQKGCRVKKPEDEVEAAVGFVHGEKEVQLERKRSSFVVDSGCRDHLVNSMDCIQSLRKH